MELINPHGVVVLDNASIHQVQAVEMAISMHWPTYFYLYIAQTSYNQIELAYFSKVKSSLKEHENDRVEGLLCWDISVIAALNTITSDDCVGWISHIVAIDQCVVTGWRGQLVD